MLEQYVPSGQFKEIGREICWRNKIVEYFWQNNCVSVKLSNFLSICTESNDFCLICEWRLISIWNRNLAVSLPSNINITDQSLWRRGRGVHCPVSDLENRLFLLHEPHYKCSWCRRHAPLLHPSKFVTAYGPTTTSATSKGWLPPVITSKFKNFPLTCIDFLSNIPKFSVNISSLAAYPSTLVEVPRHPRCRNILLQTR